MITLTNDTIILEVPCRVPHVKLRQIKTALIIAACKLADGEDTNNETMELLQLLKMLRSTNPVITDGTKRIG